MKSKFWLIAVLMILTASFLAAAPGVGVLEPWLENDPSPKLSAALDANSQNITSAGTITGTTITGTRITCPDPTGSSGNYCEYFGVNAGANVNAAANLTVLGNNAAGENTSGHNSVVVGTNAAYWNQTGLYNTIIGSWAGYGVSGNSFSNSTIVGYNAGRRITTGGITAVGYGALTYSASAERNTAVGEGACSKTTAGSNTAVGFWALSSNTIGASQVAVGSQALANNVDGTFNTAGGGQSLTTNVSGDSNSAWGWGSLDQNLGSYNSGLGRESGYRQESGEYNVFVGFQAGDGDDANYSASRITAVGAESLFNLESNADDNSAFGYHAGYSLTTAADCVFLGAHAGYRQTTLSNRLIIDNQLRDDAAEEITNSILYGVMADAVGDQTLRINANLFLKADDRKLYFGTGDDASIKYSGTKWIFDIEQATDLIAFNPDGDNTDFVFGSSQLDDTGVAVQDLRMFFDKGKAAFRAGEVTGPEWDAANIGNHSFAVGYGTTASGNCSFAIGYGTTASGDFSTAIGWSTTASGNCSFAIGKSFTNSVADSFAAGFGQKDFDVQSGAVRAIGTFSAGDGGSTNYAQFAADGELALHGTARVIKEICMVGADYGHGGTPPAPAVVGNYLVWEYDLADDSVLSFELPPGWAAGTDLTVKVDWAINEAYATNSGEVQWNVGWSAVPHDNTEALDSPTHSGTLDPGDINIPGTAQRLNRTTLGTISGASLSANDEIGLNLERVALDGGNNPTADPYITHLRIEYTADKLGTGM